ncbi:ComEC/Rec2 family competence protein [Christensenella tenuis]|uniref:ComEC/Rec2 family competence protein n=1 Tax=Christensenella tenuis TaxID=2763033 RepID=A0ABR7EDV7_9FIRM|nr:ComEC/Rec2 family competence protein [Christensenella tenuis]MBC5647269.1 ComEC/Rec2 family competence protein [Christensenella tenuis]
MKRVLNPRPVAFLAFFLVVGIAAAYYLGLPGVFSLPAWILCGILFGILFFKQKKQMFPVLYLFAFFLGAFLFQMQFHTDFSGFDPNRIYRIEGYVSDRSKMEAETHTYLLTDVKIGGKNFGKKVILYSPDILEYGDTVVTEGEVAPPSPPRNPGDFDETMYLAGKGAGFSLYRASLDVEGNELSWYQYPFLLREKLAEKMNGIFSQESAPIAKAMFLGIKDEISQETRDSFSKTGIAHILAISGLHVAILSYAFNFMLKKLKAERRVRFTLNIVILILYATLTGFAPSILRAVLMTIFVIIGRWKFSKRDTLVFLSAALIFTLLGNTTQLFLPGLLMSYGVVFGILCLNPPLMRLFRKIHLDKAKVDAPLATSLSATTSVFPMTAYFFNNVALAAPLANFFAIPLAGIIVLFSGIGTVVSLGIPQAGRILAFPAEISIRGLTWLNEQIAQSSFGFIEVNGFPVWACIAVLAVIFLCSDYMLIKRRTKALMVGVLTGAILFAGIAAVPSVPLRVVILDVGTGDAIHVSAEGKDYLIDNGGNLQYSNISNYAEKNGIVFDGIIVTNDRTKNLKQLAADSRIKTLYVPENYQAKEYDTQYPVKEYTLYDKIELNENIFLENVGADGKYQSLVLRYRGEAVCLFAQTMPEYLEFEGPVSVLKPAGGGRKGSVTEELLIKTEPQYAVISVKENNKKGLPDSTVLSLLQKEAIRLFVTSEDGAVTILVNGQGDIQIQTEKRVVQ